ncbi:MAG: DNA gyrase subunit A [Candidatus Marinimicrobia bacterium]|nr:DNA gyrase subunit A [Candidatus Neomarinimicrobiota bacterium]|tara:strand:+ start:1835 stop:4309 length:2475 start_codon:yes stop_codon:yes gene_type:complete
MEEEFKNQSILGRDLVDEMEESYLSYAMSVIISRALPDVRDGLKPVHRRVLYGAAGIGAQWNRKHKKSARIVGEVIGKYHPHGDQSIYDSLVRMAQPWSLRYLLIDGQGNFGSVDGDGAAAMRYTEAKMSKIASEMLKDIEKETVSLQPNFDDSLEEPSVLPTQIPNLLMNGSEGIAVGMATKIPPHNLKELVSGLVALLENPNITSEELFEQHIKGPDFPTAGFIMGIDGIKEAYTTGRGRVVMRGRATIEEKENGKEVIIINEIPYQVNKASLIERVADLVREKKLEGISDLRDESDKDGMRIVIECKRDAIAEIILNNLYKQTQLQDTFGIIMLAIVEGVPKVMSIQEVLNQFLLFRREIIIKRTKFDLKEAETRAHILEGLKKALENIDKVIELIKKSKNPDEAKTKLIKMFNFTDVQTKAILDMRLQKLTSLETDKLLEELMDLQNKIKHYQDILNNYQLQSSIIKEELLEINNKYGDERKTEIIPISGDLTIEDMIADEDMVVTISHNGYIKRLPVSTWKTQNRGGKGMRGANTKQDDFVEHLFIASTHNTMLFFTDTGKCYWLKVHQIPQASRTSQGRAIINLIGCGSKDKVKAFVSVKEFTEEQQLIMCTKKGLIKRSRLMLYSRPRKGGIYAVDVNDGDELIQAKISTGDQDVLLATNNGKAIRFNENQIRSTGRKTKGVTGIRMSFKDDFVIGMLVVKREGQVLVVSSKGFGKRSLLEEYREQKRGGKGVFTLKANNKTGKLISIMEVVDEDDLMIITDKGIMIRQTVTNLSIIGRNTQGVKLLKLDEKAQIASVTKVIKEDEFNEEEEQIKSE